jgi:pyridoxal 5'-phosphate synthase pdxS subunit
VFVGSGIFTRGDPERRAGAITQAAPYWDNPQILAEVRRDSGELIGGISNLAHPRKELCSGRGS